MYGIPISTIMNRRPASCMMSVKASLISPGAFREMRYCQMATNDTTLPVCLTFGMIVVSRDAGHRSRSHLKVEVLIL